MLSDAWGNVIDEVTYRDTLPWPMSADGRGYFLVLRDLDADNNLGENWTTESELVGIPHYDQHDTGVQVSPNPTKGLVNIVSDNPMDQVSVLDVQGRVILLQKTSTFSATMDLSGFKPGVYFVRVNNQKRQSAVMKIVKW